MIKKITILFLLISGFTFGQRMNPESNPRIKRLKIAFITERLDLTIDEAQQFWPIYNAHEEHMFQLRHVEMRKIRNELKDNFSEKKAEVALQHVMNIENDIHQANQQLVADLRDVLPAHKILLLKKAEKDFPREIMKQFREKRQKKSRQ